MMQFYGHKVVSKKCVHGVRIILGAKETGVILTTNLAARVCVCKM